MRTCRGKKTQVLPSAMIGLIHARRCAGSSPPSLACSYVRITDGLGRLEDPAPLDQVGTVACVVQSSQTATSLLTQTRSGTTAIETLTTVTTASVTQTIPAPFVRSSTSTTTSSWAPNPAAPTSLSLMTTSRFERGGQTASSANQDGSVIPTMATSSARSASSANGANGANGGGGMAAGATTSTTVTITVVSSAPTCPSAK
ncbi:hypothetical protein PGQ11_010251 [Apiospora arundinis]|uniref:Uncharacterized protein n=1 Tax=Apiospora arundinis TaxID=335852 RepID=A0ABR2I945_9PEZI